MNTRCWQYGVSHGATLPGRLRRALSTARPRAHHSTPGGAGYSRVAGPRRSAPPWDSRAAHRAPRPSPILASACPQGRAKLIPQARCAGLSACALGRHRWCAPPRGICFFGGWGDNRVGRVECEREVMSLSSKTKMGGGGHSGTLKLGVAVEDEAQSFSSATPPSPHCVYQRGREA